MAISATEFMVRASSRTKPGTRASCAFVLHPCALHPTYFSAVFILSRRDTYGRRTCPHIYRESALVADYEGEVVFTPLMSSPILTASPSIAKVAVL